MNNASLAHKIADQLNRACALEITTTAIETIEECLGEAMHTEKNLRLTSKIAEEAELERCLTIVEECCVALKSSKRAAMKEAREMGMIDAEMFYAHGVWTVDELYQLIEKAIME